MDAEQQRIDRILNTILSDSDRRIYGIIKENPCTKKDLGHRTKFPTNLLDKILKQLASYNLVKSIKRPQSKNINVWVLYGHMEQEDEREHLAEKDDLMALIRKKENGISIAELQKDAIRKGIKIDHFEPILTVMQLRGEIYLINGHVVKRQIHGISSPCVECKVRDLCSPTGMINPRNCPYLISW